MKLFYIAQCCGNMLSLYLLILMVKSGLENAQVSNDLFRLSRPQRVREHMQGRWNCYYHYGPDRSTFR